MKREKGIPWEGVRSEREGLSSPAQEDSPRSLRGEGGSHAEKRRVWVSSGTVILGGIKAGSVEIDRETLQDLGVLKEEREPGPLRLGCYRNPLTKRGPRREKE